MAENIKQFYLIEMFVPETPINCEQNEVGSEHIVDSSAFLLFVFGFFVHILLKILFTIAIL